MPVTFRRTLAVALLALAAATAATAAEEAPPMTFTDAVEMLNRERLSAVACARVVKRHLPAEDPAAYSAAELDYEAAREDFNAVIVRLQVALVERTEAEELAALERRTASASDRRAAFCATAGDLRGEPVDGQKSVIGDIVTATVGELLEMVRWWVDGETEADRLRRKQLEDRLEEEKWPAFAAIAPDA